MGVGCVEHEHQAGASVMPATKRVGVAHEAHAGVTPAAKRGGGT